MTRNCWLLPCALTAASPREPLAWGEKHEQTGPDLQFRAEPPQLAADHQRETNVCAEQQT